MLVRGIDGERGVFHGGWGDFRSYACVEMGPHSRAIFHGYRYEEEAPRHWEAVFFGGTWEELSPRR